MIYVSRASGLLEPFTVPEITIDAAIDRGWERDGRLLLPRPAEFLPTYPLPGFGIPSGMDVWLSDHLRRQEQWVHEFIWGLPSW